MNDADLPMWLSVSDLARFFRVSKRTIRRYTADGRIPQPVRLTMRTLRWHSADIFDMLRHGPMPFGFYHGKRPIFDDNSDPVRN